MEQSSEKNNPIISLKMSKNFVWFLITIVILGSVSILSYVESKKIEYIKDINQDINMEDEFPLYSEYNWQKTTNYSSDSFKIYLDNYAFENNNSLRKTEEIKPIGILWTAVVDYPTDSSRNNGLINFYNEFFKKNNWSSGVLDIPQYRITATALSADGVLGGVWGYLKVENETLKYVGFSSVYKKYVNNSSYGPEEVSCPCKVEYKIFISNGREFNGIEL